MKPRNGAKLSARLESRRSRDLEVRYFITRRYANPTIITLTAVRDDQADRRIDRSRTHRAGTHPAVLSCVGHRLAGGQRASVSSGRPRLRRRSRIRRHSGRGAILRPGSGSCRAKIPPGASRSRGRATAICAAFWWWGPMRSCATRSRTLKNIPGSRSFWRDDPSRSWQLRSPTRWRAWPGRCWPTGTLTGRLSLRQRRKGLAMGGRGCVCAFTNCRGDEDIDAKRSKPSMGKPVVGHARKERVLLLGTDQRITSGPAANAAALKGRIHDCTRTLR
jgi:hypothetical protein